MMCRPGSRSAASDTESRLVENKKIRLVKVVEQKSGEEGGEMKSEERVLALIEEIQEVGILSNFQRQCDEAFDMAAHRAVADRIDSSQRTVRPPAKPSFQAVCTLRKGGAVVGSGMREDVIQRRKTDSHRAISELNNAHQFSLRDIILQGFPFSDGNHVRFGFGDFSFEQQSQRKYSRRHFAGRDR